MPFYRAFVVTCGAVSKQRKVPNFLLSSAETIVCSPLRGWLASRCSGWRGGLHAFMLVPHQDDWDDHPLLQSTTSRASSSRAKFRQLSKAEKKSRENNWNSHQFIPTPASLRGINLLAGKTAERRAEPWSLDMTYFVNLLKLGQQPWVFGYGREDQTEAEQESTAQSRYWESTARDVHDLESWSKSKRLQAKLRIAATSPKPDWDSSPMHGQPWALRGLKPVTSEPWDRDARIRDSKDPDELRRLRQQRKQPTPYELEGRNLLQLTIRR